MCEGFFVKYFVTFFGVAKTVFFGNRVFVTSRKQGFVMQSGDNDEFIFYPREQACCASDPR